MSLTNNPLSKFRHRPKRNKKKKKCDYDIENNPEEFQPCERTFSDSFLDIKKNKRRLAASRSKPDEQHKRESADSGYFSIDPEEQVYFVSPGGELKWNDLDPFLEDEIPNGNSTEKASNFIRKRTKFLQCKYNLKLGKNKDKPSKDKTLKPTLITQKENTENKEEAKEPLGKAKKLRWRKAKKQASIIVRFIKRDSKEDDEVSLIRTASIRMSRRMFDEHFTRTHNSNIESQIRNHNNQNKDVLPDDENVMSSFKDSFTSLSVSSKPLTNCTSPINPKYISPLSIARSRPHRDRAQSMYVVSNTSTQSEHIDVENNNSDFAKYLNKSKSLEDLRENLHESSIFSVEDPFADFEPDVTVHCALNDSFNILSTLIEGDEDTGNDEDHSELNGFEFDGDNTELNGFELDGDNTELNGFQFDGDSTELTRSKFDSIVEEEVDNYILNGFRNEADNISYVGEDCLDDYVDKPLKQCNSFSYSVNDLYELFNRDDLFSLDYGIDGLLV